MQQIAFGFFIFFFADRLSGQQQIPFCQVNEHQISSGTLLTVASNLVFTSHGLYLVADNCSRKPASAVVLTPGVLGAPNVPYQLDKSSLDPAAPYYRINGGASTACGVLTGSFARNRE